MLKYDRHQALIGLEPVKLGTEGSFRIKRGAAKGRDRRIHAASFCRYYGISIDHTERFDSPEIDQNGTLRLDLKCTHDVSNQRKRRKTGAGN